MSAETMVVYLAATGRSGTTLLERALATSPDFVSLGEVVHLWERGLRRGEPCGCGVPLPACPFWSEVGRKAFGGWDAVDLDEVQAWQRAADRNRYIPLLVMPRLAPKGFRTALAGFTDVLARLYAAISEVAGADAVLVDASKHPSYLYVLRHVRGIDVRELQVVRDPRGVAHSWSKVVDRPEAGETANGGEMMEQLGPWRAGMRWSSHQLLFHLARLFGVPRRRLVYERFVDDPAMLRGVMVELTAPRQVEAPRIIDGTIELATNHTVSGNPMRFRTGSITLRRDEAWRTALRRRDRLVVDLLTLPLRLLYGR